MTLAVIRQTVLILLAFAVPALSAQDSPRVITDPDAYQIYGLVADALGDYASQKPRDIVPLIERTSRHSGICIKPETVEEHQKFDSALADFKDKNAVEWTLEQNGFSGTRIKVVPSTEKFGLFVAAIGFNRDKTVAVVYGYFGCGGLCGHGEEFVFVKEDGKWKRTHVGKTTCMTFS